MRIFGLVGLLAVFVAAGCSKAEAQDQPAHEHKGCKCETKVSEPIWRVGTLCQKGELSQGHGLNKNGQEVSGCSTLKNECVCEPQG